MKRQPIFSSDVCFEESKLACFCSAAGTRGQCSEMVFSSWIPAMEVSQQRATGSPPHKWFDIVLPAQFPPRLSPSHVIKQFTRRPPAYPTSRLCISGFDTGAHGKYRVKEKAREQGATHSSPLQLTACVRCSTAALTIHAEQQSMCAE